MSSVGEAAPTHARGRFSSAAANPSLAVVFGAVMVLAVYFGFAFPLSVLPIQVFPHDAAHQILGGLLLNDGKILHRDINGPLGYLAYAPYAWALQLTDNAAVAASLVRIGQLSFAALLLALVVRGRLTTGFALLIAVMLAVTVLQPMNLGEKPARLTTAMDYKKFGFALLIVIAVTLYFRPKQPGRAGQILSCLVLTLALFCLFHLKISYFAVGVGLVLCSPIHSAGRAQWLVTLAAAALVALAIWLDPGAKFYLDNILLRASEDSLGLGPGRIVQIVRENVELMIFGGVILGLYFSMPALREDFLACGIIVGGGFAALTQNMQLSLVPVAVVGLVLLAMASQEKLAGTPGFRVQQWLLAGMPVFYVAFWSVVFVLGLRFLDAQQARADRAVSSVPELQGFSYPATTDVDQLAAWEEAGPDTVDNFSFWNTNPVGASLLATTTWPEARRLLAEHDLQGRKILELDVINFSATGDQWPTGWYLWVMEQFDPRPFEEFGNEVEVILVPKYPRFGTKERLKASHGEQIAAEFTTIEDGRMWQICVRTTELSDPMPDSGPCVW